MNEQSSLRVIEELEGSVADTAAPFPSERTSEVNWHPLTSALAPLVIRMRDCVKLTVDVDCAGVNEREDN